jgi:flagellar biosynthetic protein FliQ
VTPEFVIQTARDAMYTALLVAAPPMGLALIIGLMVSIFQAVTQISEVTLAFIPKILAVFGGLLFFGPFMLDTLMKFSINIFSHLPDFVH